MTACDLGVLCLMMLGTLGCVGFMCWVEVERIRALAKVAEIASEMAEPKT